MPEKLLRKKTRWKSKMLDMHFRTRTQRGQAESRGQGRRGMMTGNTETDDLETRKPRLRNFLSPVNSKLRPFLALFGIKNFVLHRNGYLVNNNPSIKWYADNLAKHGISENYWGIRRQLRKMAAFGIFEERRTLRPVDNSSASYHRLSRIEFCEYYLNPGLFPVLCQALKDVFAVGSLSTLFEIRLLGSNAGSPKPACGEMPIRLLGQPANK